MSAEEDLSSVKVSQEVRDRTTRLQGAIQFETGDSVAIGEAIGVATEAFIDDLPGFVDEDEVTRLRDQPGATIVRVTDDTMEDLVRIRGFIQFETGVDARLNEAVALALDRYLQDFPLPL